MLTRKDVACPVNGPHHGECRIKSTGEVIGRVMRISVFGVTGRAWEYGFRDTDWQGSREGAIAAVIERWNRQHANDEVSE